MDFPDGPVVKNLACNAVGKGLIPGWGTKIEYCCGTIKPMCRCYEPMQHNQRVLLQQQKILHVAMKILRAANKT